MNSLFFSLPYNRDLPAYNRALPAYNRALLLRLITFLPEGVHLGGGKYEASKASLEN